METLAKSGLTSTDRLQQTVLALARLLDQTMNDIQTVDSEIQERVLRAIQETEATFERQSAERLRRAVEETEQNIRIVVTEELHAQLREQTASQLEAVRNESFTERAQLTEELSRLKQAAAEWQSERTQLLTNYQRANQLLEQSKHEYSREMAEADEAAAIALERQIATLTDRIRKEATSQWDAERAKLVTERDRALQALAQRDNVHEQALSVGDSVRSDLADERDWLRQQLDQVKRLAAQLETERNQLRAECENSRRLAAEATSEQARLLSDVGQLIIEPSKPAKSPIDLDALRAEVTRVEGLIHAISDVIEDPATELSVVIRQNAERAELESYLRGIRFILPK